MEFIGRGNTPSCITGLEQNSETMNEVDGERKETKPNNPNSLALVPFISRKDNYISGDSSEEEFHSCDPSPTEEEKVPDFTPITHPVSSEHLVPESEITEEDVPDANSTPTPYEIDLEMTRLKLQDSKITTSEEQCNALDCKKSEEMGHNLEKQVPPDPMNNVCFVDEETKPDISSHDPRGLHEEPAPEISLRIRQETTKEERTEAGDDCVDSLTLFIDLTCVTFMLRFLTKQNVERVVLIGCRSAEAAEEVHNFLEDLIFKHVREKTPESLYHLYKRFNHILKLYQLFCELIQDIM